MYRALPTINLIAGIALAQMSANGGSAVSSEARDVEKRASTIIDGYEKSLALFGPKSRALSQLAEAVRQSEDCDAIAADPLAVQTASNLIRALPDSIPLPEFAVDPDGCISLDWIESRHRIFSLRAGPNRRLAYAWLNGTDKGYAVAGFDGDAIPSCVLDGILSVVRS